MWSNGIPRSQQEWKVCRLLTSSARQTRGKFVRFFIWHKSIKKLRKYVKLIWVQTVYIMLTPYGILD